jgi:hypothetical protein
LALAKLLKLNWHKGDGMKTFDANPAAAMSFLISQRTFIEPQLYEVRYPGVTYQDILPVDTSAPEWTPIVAVQSMDSRGELKFTGPNSNDSNRAEVGFSLGTHAIQDAQLGYGYSLTELNQALLMNRNLSDEKARATMRIMEQGLNKLAYLGDSNAGYTGLFNDADVSVASAPGTISALAAAATDVAGAQAIVQFFQSALNKVYVSQTRTTFMPTHILLPPAQRQTLAATILPFGGNMTLLGYIEANLDAGNGQRVTIRGDISLEGAGAADADRMMVYTRDPEALKFHLPMSPRFLTPYQDSGTSWFIPGMTRTGGTEIRIPGAHAYFDGV